MSEVDISGGIEVGPLHFSIEVGGKTAIELRDNKDYGECLFQAQIIKITDAHSPERFNETFLHEAIEAINDIYCNRTLKHEQIRTLASGLAQVMKSVGVQFIYTEVIEGGS